MDAETTGRARGGKARAEKLTPERRKEISQKAVAAKKERADMPYATHSGPLAIGDLVLDCYHLDDDRRVIHKRGMANALDLKSKGGNAFLKTMSGKSIGSSLPSFLQDRIDNPIVFKRSAGDLAHGYDAEVLVEIASAIVDADHEGRLVKSQSHIADRARILLKAFAKVGIIALVDEATGYQKDRQKDALAKILEAFVAKEIQPYLKTFPSEYYENLFRLYGLHYPPTGNKSWRPGFFGKITNDVIYSRLAPEILPELKKLASKAEKKAYLHQCLTQDIGHPKLKEHLASIVSLQRISSTPQEWLDFVNRAHPKHDPSPSQPLDFDAD